MAYWKTRVALSGLAQIMVSAELTRKRIKLLIIITDTVFKVMSFQMELTLKHPKVNCFLEE